VIGSRAFWRLGPTALGLALLADGAAMPARMEGGGEPGPRLLRSDDGGIVVALDTPPFDVTRQLAGEAAFDMLNAPGLASSGRPGYPDLPVAAVLLGIPPRGTPRLHTAVDGMVTWGRAVRLAPVASPDGTPLDDLLVPGDDTTIDAKPAPARGAVSVPYADPGAYTNPGLYPAEPAAITEVGWIRDQRFARIELRPFQYNAAARALHVHARVRAALTIEPSHEPSAEPSADGPAGRSAAPAWTESGEIPAGAPADPAFDPILDRLLLNAQSARGWRVPRPGAFQAPASSIPPGPGDGQPTWNIAVDGEGMVRVSGADLALAALPIETLDPQRLRLYAAGEPVAIRVLGDADGVLNPSDAVIFFGQPSRSRYSAVNIYQLAHGGAPGLRMAERDGTPAGGPVPAAFTDTLHIEQDLLYRSDFPKRSGDPDAEPPSDHWFWQQLSAPQAMAQVADLPGVAPGAWSGRVRIAAVGKSAFATVDPDHRLKLAVAGSDIGAVTWDGNTGLAVRELPVGSERLAGGSVQIGIEAPEPDIPLRDYYDHSYIDWIEVDYRRTFTAGADGLLFTFDVRRVTDFAVGGLPVPDVAVYDVTDPAHPEMVIGAGVRGAGLSGASAPYSVRFRADTPGRRVFHVVPRAGYRSATRVEARPPADLRSPDRGADYLIIKPASLRAAVQPLADHRAAQGRRVAMVDLQSAYDTFSGGVPGPEAIRDLIAYAFHNWQAPAPTHVLLVGDGTYDPRNRLGKSPPTLLPPFLKEVDPWLGEVAAENAFATVSGSDSFPDVLLGRLAVNSAAEATATVNKILDYEMTPPSGPWRNRLLFATDNPDTAGDFYAISDDIVDRHVPAGYAVERIYFGQTHTDSQAARTAIGRALNQGALLAQYVGHGLSSGWAQELIFRRTDAEALTNGGRLPVMLDMTCMTGYFTDPSKVSIAEAAVRASGGGAIAAFSPTGFGVATGHDYINRAFIDLLLGQGVTQLGQVAVASKLALARATSLHRDLIETFALFGDPALTVQLPFVPPPTPTGEATVFVQPTPTPTATGILGPTPTATNQATRGSVTPTPTRTPSARRYLPLVLERRPRRR